MLLPHNKVSGGVQDSQIMIPSFFDRFYVMPPLTNGVHYTCEEQHISRKSRNVYCGFNTCSSCEEQQNLRIAA